jgi:hypothetical protein
MPPFGLTCPTPLSIVAELALVVVQVKDVLCPTITAAGFAVKEFTVGATGTPTNPTQPVRDKVVHPKMVARTTNLPEETIVRVIGLKLSCSPQLRRGFKLGSCLMGTG